MAEIIQNLFYKVRALLDEYTDDGVLVAESDVADMQAKSILLADMAHKELYDRALLVSTVTTPTDITLITNTTQVNYKADQAMVYYIAARLAPFENKELVTFFEDKYDELKRKCVNKVEDVAITDAYPTESEVETEIS